MEDIVQPVKLSEKDRMEREYRLETRDKRITQARANVVKKQIVDAYEILERIRFDYVSDTAFRDKITEAKRGLESALCDFLLSDHYHETKRKEQRKLTPKEYDKKMREMEIGAEG